MIDYKVFDDTYSDFGSEMINEIIDIYISEHEDRFREMYKNISDGELEILGKNAHSLKGSTAVLYDSDVVELARQVEYKGKNNDSTGIEELLNSLKKDTDRLIVDLKKLKEKYK